MRGGLVLAGVLLLVIFPQPVEEEDAEGAACNGDAEAETVWSLTARCFGVELVVPRFSLESRVWLVLARGVERWVVEEEIRLELLVGVLGTGMSSS